MLQALASEWWCKNRYTLHALDVLYGVQVCTGYTVQGTGMHWIYCTGYRYALYLDMSLWFQLCIWMHSSVGRWSKLEVAQHVVFSTSTLFSALYPVHCIQYMQCIPVPCTVHPVCIRTFCGKYCNWKGPLKELLYIFANNTLCRVQCSVLVSSLDPKPSGYYLSPVVKMRAQKTETEATNNETSHLHTFAIHTAWMVSTGELKNMASTTFLIHAHDSVCVHVCVCLNMSVSMTQTMLIYVYVCTCVAEWDFYRRLHTRGLHAGMVTVRVWCIRSAIPRVETSIAIYI